MTALPYSERVLQLFRTLPGAGAPAAGPGRLAVGEAGSLGRGAWVRFEARVDSGRIVDCGFRAWGCPHTLAAAAVARTWMLAWQEGSASQCEAARLARELDVPAAKMGRMLVVEDAGKALLAEAARVQ
jgi:NifU-like protein involved in Fe-S cluster formation